jgi:uncharacterized membrane protein YphA (DoxX/SURF4 family)
MAHPAVAPYPASNKGTNVAVWVLQILTAAAFLAAGGAKLAGVPQMVAEFQTLGLGQWFRYVTAFLEIAGGIGLLIPRYTFYAAALLVTVMVGALIAHFAVLGGSPAPAVTLLVFAGTIVYFRRPAKF